LVKRLIRQDIPVKGAKVVIFGFTFKENCPDTRNTKVMDIYDNLLEYGIKPIIVDPTADADEARRLYGVELQNEYNAKTDAAIVAVAHDEFKKYDVNWFSGLYGEQAGDKVFFDLKGMYNKEVFCRAGFDYWRL